MSAPSESEPVAAPDAASPPAAAAGGGGGKSLVTRTIGFSGEHLTYLDLMRDRYSLGTVDKALRCIVNYAERDGDRRFIFATYRCRTCGIKFPKRLQEVQLYDHQWRFIDQMQTEFKIDDPKKDGKPIRALLDFTQEGRTKRGMTDAQKAEVLQSLEKEMFEVVRCNQKK